MIQQKLPQISNIELVYHPKIKAIDRHKIKGVSDVYQLLIQNWNCNKIELLEEFKILLLDGKNAVLGMVNISSGGFNSVHADPKVIFSAALLSGASGIILAHNHPSGELNPSVGDKQVTAELKKGAKTLGLVIIDHLIISPGGYYSFLGQQALSAPNRQ